MNNCLISDPVLSKELKLKINAIAKCLSNYPYLNNDLMGGKAGIAIFWAYYFKYSEQANLGRSLVPLLDIFNGIKRSNIYPSFANGIAGLGWTIEHIKQFEFIQVSADALLARFDELLYPYMLKYVKEGNYDYLHGALGIGLYYLKRNSNSKTKKYIIDLINELKKNGKLISDNIVWETIYSNDSYEKVINLGLSHGIASIIVILSRFYQANIASKEISQLVEGAVNYLLQNKNDPNLFDYCFPSFIRKNEQQKNKMGRLAWCYNDLGVSMALLQAGEIFNNPEWKQEATNSLLHTTSIRDLNEAGVSDACLCHGTTGIAHIYNRAYQYTGVDEFKNSAIYWFEQSLNMAVFEDGPAGFKTI
jgi:lantibiotic modifying enzyme